MKERVDEISVDFSWVITPDLKEEWLVRELIHFIQSKRRGLGCEIGAVVDLRLLAEEPLYTILLQHRTEIEEETQSHISVVAIGDEDTDLLCKYRISVCGYEN